MLRSALATGIAAFGLAVVLWPDDAPPTCGGFVHGEVVLADDVVGCEHEGLRLGPFAQLDCAGHEIRGTEEGASGYGVVLEDIEESSVRNCRITGFAQGIRIRGGRGNSVTGNEIAQSHQGIEIARVARRGVSAGHRVSGNRISDSQEGIHVGVGAQAVTLEDNVVDRAGRKGIAIEGCRGCVVHRNTIQRVDGAALDLKDSVDGDLRDNTIHGSVLRVRGRSERNVLEGNQLVGAGYVFAAMGGQGEDGGGRIPSQNHVMGGAVLQSQICFQFRGARDNQISRVRVDGCQIRSDRPTSGINPVDNRVSNLDPVALG